MASTEYQTEASRWAALRARDPAADGAFVYSVKTTKIYCRPTCKARLARRSNVAFHDRPEEAVSQGFRPCKRCKPELETFVPEADQSIERIRVFIEKLPEDKPLPKLEVLASSAGLTKYHFHRCFKKATGMTPREYAISRRQSRSMNDIQVASTGDLSTGMSTPSLSYDSTPLSMPTPEDTESVELNFDDWLSEEPVVVNDGPLAVDPVEEALRDEAIKAAISYDIYYTTLETTGGMLLMAFQDDQVCKLELLSSLYEVAASLERSFPSCIYVHTPAELLPDDKRHPMEMRIAAVAEALE